jgi:NADH-quinone oxidoreductase subunit M
MIAHGFVVVGLFLLQTLFIEDKTRTIDKWEVFVHKHQICFDVLILVLAGCITNYFNFVGEFTVLYSLASINVWYAVLGGTTIILERTIC